MILILTTIHENSTDNVIEWLIKKEISFYRINENAGTVPVKIEINNQYFQLLVFYNGNFVDLNGFSKVWFRRGGLDFFYPYLYTQEANEYIDRHLNIESRTLTDFIYSVLSEKKSLNHPLAYNMNKLIALKNAISVGFDVPQTLITNQVSLLNEFKENHGAVFTKPIQDCIFVNEKDMLSQKGNVNQDNFRDRKSVV